MAKVAIDCPDIKGSLMVGHKHIALPGVYVFTPDHLDTHKP